MSMFMPKKAFLPKKLDLGCHVNVQVVRDYAKRLAFQRHEAERQALRYIIRNTTLPQRTRVEAQLQLAQMPGYSRPAMIRNRCVVSGKGRAVFRDFKMTRYQFRLFALAGELPGVRKASW